MEDNTNTGLVILSVGHAGIHGQSNSLATRACRLLPPSPTVKGDPQNCRTKSINCARVQLGSSSQRLIAGSS